MKRASGIGHLKPFLPCLEAVLEDPEVSELMINGPGNVWVERGGELEPIEAPALTAAVYRFRFPGQVGGLIMPPSG